MVDWYWLLVVAPSVTTGSSLLGLTTIVRFLDQARAVSLCPNGSPTKIPVPAAADRRSRVAGDEHFVELESQRPIAFCLDRRAAVALHPTQSDHGAATRASRASQRRCTRSAIPRALRSAHAQSRSRADEPGHLGRESVIPSSSTARSRTSVRSSGCTTPCRSTPVALASWPAITARRRRTLESHSLASACSTRRATSTNICGSTDGRRIRTSSSTPRAGHWSRCSGPGRSHGSRS